MSKSKFGGISRKDLSLRGNIGAFIRGSRDRAVKAFDNSYTAFALKKLREGAPYIQNHVIGAFLFTFGVYSLLIAIFKMVFEFGGSYSDIYVSACAAILALPLLLSRESLASVLTDSDIGKMFSGAVGIRLHVREDAKVYGRSNIAFLVGMIFGTLTFVVPPLTVLLIAVLIIGVCIIFTYPESSALLIAVMLPFGNAESFCFVAVAGTIAYLIKVFRGKRSISFHHHRAVVAIFLFVVFFAEVFTGSVRYSVMLLLFFLLSMSDGLGGRVEKTAAAAIISCGCVSAVYLGFGYASYFGRLDGDFETFDVSRLSLMCVALIPLAASFAINKAVLPRRTAVLCLLTMTVFLVKCESQMYLAAALFSVMLLLFFYRRRAAYAVFAAFCSAYAIWVWLGGSNRKAINLLLGFLKEFGVGEDGTHVYMITGIGLEDGFAGSESFYGAVITKLGVIGLVILISSVVLLCGYILREKNGKGSDRSHDSYMRAWAPACSVLVLLICGLGTNVWACDSVYALFWIMMGAASSIAADSEKKALRRYQSKEIGMSSDSAEVTVKNVSVWTRK